MKNRYEVYMELGPLGEEVLIAGPFNTKKEAMRVVRACKKVLKTLDRWGCEISESDQDTFDLDKIMEVTSETCDAAQREADKHKEPL